MTQYSVAEAKNQLSDLIDHALAGEDVVILRHGHPVVEPKAIRPPVRPLTQDDLAWLAAHRIRSSATTDAGSLLSRMRDEDER
jgi:antitoxin (DNA-binding transcriptional repressor) of toxin-antitoxin stability system